MEDVNDERNEVDDDDKRLNYNNAQRAAGNSIEAMSAADAAIAFDKTTDINQKEKEKKEEEEKKKEEEKEKNKTKKNEDNESNNGKNDQTDGSDTIQDPKKQQRTSPSNDNSETSNQQKTNHQTKKDKDKKKEETKKINGNKNKNQNQKNQNEKNEAEDRGKPNVQSLSKGMDQTSLMFLQVHEQLHAQLQTRLQTHTFKKPPKKGLGALTKIMTGKVKLEKTKNNIKNIL